MNSKSAVFQVSGSQKRHITILSFLVAFLMGIGVDLYVPSLPFIVRYFHASHHLVKLTVGFYMLGYALGQLFLGVLSDSFGRKNTLLVSALFFTLVSVLSIFSPNLYYLNIYRFLQGVGIAGLAVNTRAINTDCFSGLTLTKIFSSISTGWALGPIIGPFIGGYLQHYFNWQANFYFFSIYGLLLFIYAILVLPETHTIRHSLRPKRVILTIAKIINHPVFMLSVLTASLFYA